MNVNPIRLGHVWTGIPGYRRSFALLSAANASEIERAVIFVHGFNGAASTTWADFLSLVDDDSAASRWWQNADLYFYHYRWDSIFQRIGYNSDQLFNFVNRVFPAPPQELFDAAEVSLRNAFQYKMLVLVGHSEGGLLVRKIILEAANRDLRLEAFVRAKGRGPATEPKPEGLLLAQPRLFAPAISGESLSGFLGLICTLPVIAPALNISSSKQGLSASAAPVRDARDYTNEWARELEMECFQADILWAEHDAIVDREKYRLDRHCTNSPPGTNHSTVCKPTRNYLTPVEFVEKGVKSGKC